MQIIIGLVLLLIVIAVAGAVIRFLLKTVGIALAIAVAAPFLPAFFVGFGLERVARPLRSGLALTIACQAFVAYWALDDLRSQSAGGNLLDLAGAAVAVIFAILVVVTSTQLLRQRVLINRSLPSTYLSQKVAQTHALLVTAAAAFTMGLALPIVASQFDVTQDAVAIVGKIYMVAAALLQLGIAVQMYARRRASNVFYQQLSTSQRVHADGLILAMAKDGVLKVDELTTMFDGIASMLVLDGHLSELDLAGGRWFFRRDWYQETLGAMDHILARSLRHDQSSLATMSAHYFSLPRAANDDFIERHLALGQHHRFSDGVHYVSFRRLPEIRTCVSCGFSEAHEGIDAISEDWYCAPICRKTEEICESLRIKSRNEFLSDAAKQGFVVMAGAAAWSGNHQVMAAGGQGHGFAAEVANNRIDRLLGRKAKVIGGNNAKHGADRLVDGTLVQTKYCKTPGKSVGQGFGPDGMYRYRGPDGSPMQLEVPRDQYDQALESMRARMRNGKVLDAEGKPMPPDLAESLIRKGHLTYEQAKNITKFGTMESIKYDVAEGAVVSVVAGGISFGVSAFLHYVNTRDHRASMQAATVQAGKTFGTTMLVYVSTQQLHRLASVQKVLTLIDFSASSSTTLRVLKDGLGVKGASRASTVTGINKAVRGTVVTSMVLVLVTTGPDLLKLIRGRMSQAQFLKNAAVGASGIAGGTVGSIVGGVLMSPLGPVGAVAGRVAGGMIGGLLASGFAGVIADELMEDDRVAMLVIVREQLEHLARTFVLSPEELDNLNANLEKVVNQKMLEKLYAEKSNPYALANHYLKPTVVGVVKQRPAFGYSVSDIEKAYESLAA
jgi:hypothetical protein